MHPGELLRSRCDRFERLIRTRPGISAAELCWATASVPAEDRKEIIELLIDDGTIRAEIVKPVRGRLKTTYWPGDGKPPVTQPQPCPRPVECDPTKMTAEQIAAENERRRSLNDELIRFGYACAVIPMLPG
jgi:hypothetical protein